MTLIFVFLYLNYESNPQSQHFLKQLGLCSDEHGQVNDQLLSQHSSTFVIPVHLVNYLTQLHFWEGTRDGLF